MVRRAQGSALRGPDPAGPALLRATLLGGFEVRVDGRRVAWRGARGAGVVRFLLHRPDRSASRDELIETFWPGVDPFLARNRLQAAVSGVRRAFAAVGAPDVVDFAAGRYRVRSSAPIEVDVDRFEAEVAAGRAAERAGDADRAFEHYAAATAHYRGDFAADAPYEPWTALPREVLRLRHLDVLDRCARIHLERGRAVECVLIAHRVLDADPCREDAHRLLMHCYALLDRPAEALRQYEACRRVLRAELGCGPASRTVALRDRIAAGPAGDRAVAVRRPGPGRLTPATPPG